MPRLRLATYNIHKARGMDGRVRVERIARVLREIHADVVALQEVVNHENGSIEDHQARYLADQLGYVFAIGETRKHRGGVYGNVTLSRRDFGLIRQVDLTVEGREERCALRTDVAVGSTLLHVFNVHLGTAFRERRAQAARMVDRDLLKAIDISGPRIVLGDFNEWTRSLVSATLRTEFRGTGLHARLSRTRTYPAFLPLLHLDQIYVDHHVTVERARFHRSRTALLASDHLPLVADVEVH
jgi:endonuclease/exonuclease/phosphatase family metal-dependent hydrolase